MTVFLDALAPASLKQALIKLELATRDPPRAGHAIPIRATPDASLTKTGLVRPLQLLVMGPDAKIAVDKTFRRLTPAIFRFIPRGGGQYFVLLRETAHDLHYGTLVIDVLGEPLQ